MAKCIPVVCLSRDSKISHNDNLTVSDQLIDKNNNLDPFNAILKNAYITGYVFSLGEKNYAFNSDIDGKEYSFNTIDLREVGYYIKWVKPCKVKLFYEGKSSFVYCSYKNSIHEAIADNQQAAERVPGERSEKLADGGKSNKHKTIYYNFYKPKGCFMDKVRWLVWIGVLIVTSKIGYDYYIFYTAELPLRYTAIADHILKHKKSDIFAFHAHNFMEDKDISNKELDKLISIAVDETGIFQMKNSTKLNLKQSKQILEDVL